MADVCACLAGCVDILFMTNPTMANLTEEPLAGQIPSTQELGAHTEQVCLACRHPLP